MSPRLPMTAREWFTAAELAELDLPGLATTKRGVQLIADREGWASFRDASGLPSCRPRKARGGGVEYHVSLLPKAAQGKLSAARPAAMAKMDRESAQLRWERLPQSIKDRAVGRLKVIERVEALQRDGWKKTAAVAFVAQTLLREARASGDGTAPSIRTIDQWFELIAGVEPQHRAAYLAPAYKGKAAMSECPIEAWELYKADFCRLEKPTHAACYRRLERLVATKGWGKLPSAKYFARRVVSEIPQNVLILTREGPKAARHSVAHAERDKSLLAPHEVTNLDGHTWDVFCKFENGEIGRPISVAIQDIASGMPLAVRFDLTLNHHGVRLAIGDAIRDFGSFDKLIMDNGRENQARQISGGAKRWRVKSDEKIAEEQKGILSILGIQAQFTTPYWGQAKPIERMFRDWAHDVAKLPAFAGAYVGHRPDAKPENYRSTAIPIAEFERIVRLELDYYRDQLGRTGVGMNGRSFRQVYLEGIAAKPPTRLTEGQLRLCLLASELRPMDAQSGAVSILDHRYWSSELCSLKRQKVVVRFDPGDLSKDVYVYDAKGRYLCAAQRVVQGDFVTIAKAMEQKKLMAKQRRLDREQKALAIRLGVADVAAAHAEIHPPRPHIPADATNVVAPAFGVPRRPDTHANFNEQAERALLARLPASS